MGMRELLTDKVQTAAALASSDAMQHMSALERLQQVRRLVETAESAQRTAVELARAEGQSWAAIAAALGTTRQAAQQRYGSD